MWNKPTENELNKLPKLYETDNKKLEDIIIHMHFFIGSCDWYMAEYSSPERLFFGYAILNNDIDNSEWGYISFDELCSIKTKLGIEVDRDLYWTAKRAGEIDGIKV